MIPPGDRNQLIEAIRRFDNDLRNAEAWRGWEQRRYHKYAIAYEDQLYPIKEIIRLATGATDFSGGEEANTYVRARGFIVVDMPERSRWWIEKTLVKGELHRESGEYALGRAIWSPQRAKNGGDFYRFMRDVRPGDCVLHLTDNEAFVGVSRAATSVEEFEGGPDGKWQGPRYRVWLEDFVALAPPLSRQVFFSSPYKERLVALLDAGTKNLFYSREPSLNQGAYLTPAPPELIEILDDAYANLAGMTLSELAGTDRIGSGGDRWTTFVEWARRFFEWPDFDKDEREYKIAIGERLREARVAIESNAVDWVAPLKRSFAKPNNLTPWRIDAPFQRWCTTDADAARAAILGVWNEQLSVAERMANFRKSVPTTAVGGMHAVVASFLLMALDPLTYTIYRPTVFDAGYALTSFHSTADGTHKYEHAQTFLDTFIEQARSRGLVLRDRLDAQSLLWCVTKRSMDEPPINDWPGELQQLLREYRGESEKRPELGHVLLIGASKAEVAAKDAEVFQPVIAEHGSAALWWSYPLSDRMVEALAEWPYLYVYAGQPKQSLLHRFHIVEHSTAAGDTGIVCPWPELIRDELRAVTREGPEKSQIFKTWFRADSIETMDEPIPLRDLERADGAAAVPTHLLNAFALWRLKSAPSKVRTWIFQANPEKWDLAHAIRELSEFTWLVNAHKNEIHSGDRVFLWQSGTEAGALALGTIVSEPAEAEQSPDEARFDKEPGAFTGVRLRVGWHLDRVLSPPIRRDALREHPVLRNLAILRQSQGTNFPVTGEEANALMELVESRPKSGASLDHLVDMTNLTRGNVSEMLDLLRSKRQFILEGPPGAGKTFVAELLGRFVTGNLLDGLTNDRFVVVQFHQSYSYEDFVQGIRPDTNNDGQLRYEVRDGIFKKLCAKAHQDPGNVYAILIDEINRGNVSRVFGELLLLLEYRDKQVRLPYSKEDEAAFSIPPNVYVIGTMNTTDRSLAQIDYALRRRFYFSRLMPVNDGRAEVLERWLAKQGIGNKDRQEILRLFVALNTRVQQELGEHFQVGHSYFMQPRIAESSERERIWEHAVLPLLEEYFYNRRDRASLLGEFRIQRLLGSSTSTEGLSEEAVL